MATKVVDGTGARTHPLRVGEYDPLTERIPDTYSFRLPGGAIFHKLPLVWDGALEGDGYNRRCDRQAISRRRRPQD